MKFKFLFVAILALIFSCNEESIELDSNENASVNSRYNSLELEQISNNYFKANNKGSSSIEERLMETINSELTKQGAPILLSTIEAYSADGAGNTVFFNNRGNKQLGADFVPNDPRRGGYSDIAYGYDGLEGATSSGLSQSETDDAILSAMNTWDNISCSSGLELYDLGASPFDLGYVSWFYGYGGTEFFTDVMHSGFNGFIEWAYGTGTNILGVTFTFVWTDGGAPTDMDNNGKDDVAFRDIYYNDAYNWQTDGSSGIDVETVVLHETGHGLSQGHFGKLSRTDKNGKFHFSPRAVMNAGYTGIQTTIGETDNGGHCSNWGEWPNN